MEIVVTMIIAAAFVIFYGRILDPSLQVGVNFTTLGFWFLVIFVGRLIAGLIFLPAKLHYEQQGKIDERDKELATIKDNRPNLEAAGEPSEDVRSILMPIDGRQVVINANFFHMSIANKPKNRIEEASARNVYAQLTYYLHTGDKLIGPIYGRWGDTEQPGTRSPLKSNKDLLTITFESSGLSHELDLALYYPNEDVICAFNNDSYSYPYWKHPDFAMNKNSIFIHVQLSGDNVDDKDWWILIDWKLASRKISLVKAPEWAKQ